MESEIFKEEISSAVPLLWMRLGMIKVDYFLSAFPDFLLWVPLHSNPQNMAADNNLSLLTLAVATKVAG